MLAWQAAALPLASSVTVLPACTAPATTSAAMGRSASITAALAFAMPAPQVWVVQLHSFVCRSFGPLGTWHIGAVSETGKGWVADCRRAMSCSAVRLPLTASISPAMPETIGAEKLVPTLKLYSSV